MRFAARLPPELWEAVLERLDDEDQVGESATSWRADLAQSAAACSLRAIVPQISPMYIFKHVRLRTAQQCARLALRLSSPSRYPDAEEMARAVETVVLRCLRPDPDVAVLAMREACVAATRLLVSIGPLWTPEQTDDLLDAPLPSLRTLDLHFNPYLDRRSYQTFLSGSYYDHVFDSLTHWPSNLRALSFVQDPLPKLPVEFQGAAGVAQPIVLFKLWSFSTWCASPAAEYVGAVRLRLPERSVLAALVSPATSTTVLPASSLAYGPPSAVLPRLEVLDLSTTYVPNVRALQPLLLKHSRLQHLVLDRCGLSPELDAAELGRHCANVGVIRARDAARAWRTMAIKDTTLVFVPSLPVLRSISIGGGPPSRDGDDSETTTPFGSLELPASAFRHAWLETIKLVHEARRNALAIFARETRRTPLARVLLVRFDPDAARRGSEAWSHLGVVACSPADVAAEDAGMAEPPVFCDVPDCPDGKLSTWDERPTQRVWRTADVPRSNLVVHPAGCGHRVARSIWDL